MRLHIIFGIRHQDYEGQHGPEVLDCWDEYQVYENGSGYQESLDRHLANMGSGKDFQVVREVMIRFPDRELDRALAVPEIKAEVETR